MGVQGTLDLAYFRVRHRLERHTWWHSRLITDRAIKDKTPKTLLRVIVCVYSSGQDWTEIKSGGSKQLEKDETSWSHLTLWIWQKKLKLHEATICYESSKKGETWSHLPDWINLDFRRGLRLLLSGLLCSFGFMFSHSLFQECVSFHISVTLFFCVMCYLNKTLFRWTALTSSKSQSKQAGHATKVGYRGKKVHTQRRTIKSLDAWRFQPL